uniref:Uncharacterized protein n=1 Tax=Anopheles culicifacies TaxID=139723 RepID=A0A182MUB5_9DIPT
MSPSKRDPLGGSLKSDPSRLKMYRCHKRLDLQQQHHKCKSYRRTLWTGSFVPISGACAQHHCEPSAPKVESSSDGSDGCRRLVQSDPVRPPYTGSSNQSGSPTAGRLRPGRRISQQLFWTGVLLLCAGFCTRTGCDDTEQFQKNSK